MILTLAFLGFLALTFLLIHRALAVCQGRTSQIPKRQCQPRHREGCKNGQQRSRISPQKSDALVPVQRA